MMKHLWISFIFSFVHCLYQVEAKKIPHKRVKFLIIGAGTAGIKAAETFHRKGFDDFIVLEGKNYIGGRINHELFEGNVVPLGAGWIHHIGKDNPIWQLAQKLKMKVHYDNYTDFAMRDGETGTLLPNAKHRFHKLHSMFDKVDMKMKSKKSDVPMRSTLGMVGWNPRSPVDQAIEYYLLDFENGVRPETTSSHLYTVTGGGSDVVMTDERKYSFILRHLAQPFIKKIKLNTVVTEIKHSRNMVIVKTKNGETYQANHIIVTVSSGVLINGLIKFTPPLPSWKMDTINLIPMCHYCKLFLKFPRRFWDNTNYIFFAQKVRGDRVHWQNFDKPTLLKEQHILMLTLTGDLCLRADQMSDGDVIEEAMASLRKVYGKQIPAPTAIKRNRWSDDPMTMGSYSNPVVGFDEEEGFKKLQARVGRIWFAGEYTSEDWGYVQGAYGTGEDTATRVMKCIYNGVCPVYTPKKKPKCITKSI